MIRRQSREKIESIWKPSYIAEVPENIFYEH